MCCPNLICHVVFGHTPPTLPVSAAYNPIIVISPNQAEPSLQPTQYFVGFLSVAKRQVAKDHHFIPCVHFFVPLFYHRFIHLLHGFKVTVVHFRQQIFMIKVAVCYVVSHAHLRLLQQPLFRHKRSFRFQISFSFRLKRNALNVYYTEKGAPQGTPHLLAFTQRSPALVRVLGLRTDHMQQLTCRQGSAGIIDNSCHTAPHSIQQTQWSQNSSDIPVPQFS